MLSSAQRCSLILPPDDDPLGEFARERPELLTDAPVPAPAPPDFLREERPTPAAAPVPEAVGVGRLRGWLRPFWAGCVVGGMTAGWFAIGWSDMTAPAGASVVSPTEGELPVDSAWTSRASSGELFAAPEVLPLPVLADGTGGSVLPPPRTAGAPVAAPRPRPVGPRRFEGSLAVDSTPVRARVFINGEPVGLTPVVMNGLPIGSRAIRVEADDHEPWWSVVQVVAQQETSVRVALPPTARAVSELAP